MADPDLRAGWASFTAKFGTPKPVYYRIKDPQAGIDLVVPLQCYGEYQYRITDPALFTVMETRPGEGERNLWKSLVFLLPKVLEHCAEECIPWEELPKHSSLITKLYLDLIYDEWEACGAIPESVSIQSVFVPFSSIKKLESLKLNQINVKKAETD
ncbi:MAG: SPFH domain-containing protein [Clostridia bacterium]|nr:SPFH domain-containing protein [Clostridia bacterium]MBO4797374.1 SPFH domain-containing protein [Candidatus Methanomethylophilaceae archaeon]MBQ4289886.1 SPFH domain-containing protein [Clostridia bacterium]